MCIVCCIYCYWKLIKHHDKIKMHIARKKFDIHFLTKSNNKFHILCIYLILGNLFEIFCVTVNFEHTVYWDLRSFSETFII